MAYNVGIITAPVGIHDVQKALGVESGDLATLCSSTAINLMAKYRPIKYNKVGVLSDAERESVRFGLPMDIPRFTANTTNPSVTWTISRINPYTDWSRLTDFSGYYHYACIPFGFKVDGSLGDGVGIQIFVNSSAGNYYAESEGSSNVWDERYNLSLANLLSRGNQGEEYANYYIGFCIHDLTNTANGSIAVVTNKKLSELTSTVPTITLRAVGTTISGVTYPGISLLNDTSRNNDTYRFIVALFANGPANGYAYQEVTNTVTVRSLAVVAGIDRKELVMRNYYTISGLVCYLVNNNIPMSYVNTTTEGGQTYYHYTVGGSSSNVSGSFTTPTGWPLHSARVYLTFKTQGFFKRNNQTEGSITVDTIVSLPQANSTYARTLYNMPVIDVYIMQGVAASSRSVEISGYVKPWAEDDYYDKAVDPNETVYFQNILTIKPS